MPQYRFEVVVLDMESTDNTTYTSEFTVTTISDGISAYWEAAPELARLAVIDAITNLPENEREEHPSDVVAGAERHAGVRLDRFQVQLIRNASSQRRAYMVEGEWFKGRDPFTQEVEATDPVDAEFQANWLVTADRDMAVPDVENDLELWLEDMRDAEIRAVYEMSPEGKPMGAPPSQEDLVDLRRQVLEADSLEEAQQAVIAWGQSIGLPEHEETATFKP